MYKLGDSPGGGAIVLQPQGSTVSVPNAEALFQGAFERVGNNLLITGQHGEKFLVQGYFSAADTPILASPEGAIMLPETARALAGETLPDLYAQAGPVAGQTPIGRVESLNGNATVTHVGGNALRVAVGDPIYKGDVVATQGPGSSLGIKFIDNTVFSLSANARMVINELVYSAGGSNNSMAANLIQGTFVFVAGQTATNGDMKITTPVATMGIRGTTPSVNINANNGATTFGLLPDPDSTRIGTYDLFELLTNRLIRSVSQTGRAVIMTSVGSTPLDRPYTVAELANSQTLQNQITSLYRSSIQSPPADQQPGQPQPQPGDRGQLTPENPLVGNVDIALLGGLQNAVDLAVLDPAPLKPTTAPLPPGAGPPPPDAKPPPVVVGLIAPDFNPILGDSTIAGDTGAANFGLPFINGGSVTENSQIVFFDLAQGIPGVAVSGVSVTAANGASVAAFLIGGTLIIDPVQFKYLTTGESVTLNVVYTASNGGATTTVGGQLVVTGFNDNPLVGTDTASATAPGAVAGSVAFGNLLLNDSDIETGSVLVIAGVTALDPGVAVFRVAPISPGPAHVAVLPSAFTATSERGVLVVQENGSYTYTPLNNLANHALGQNATATDEFTYTVRDSDGGQSTGSFVITLTGQNDAPEASADESDAYAAGETAAIAATGNVLDNDHDVDVGDIVLVTSVEGTPLPPGGATPVTIAGLYGSLTMHPDGSYSYAPFGSAELSALGVGQNVSESFDYTIADGYGGTSGETLTIEVYGQNDAPTAVGETPDATAPGVGPATPATGDLLANDFDVDTGDTIRITDVNGAPMPDNVEGFVDHVGAFGVWHVAADGSFTYTPDDDVGNRAMAEGESVTETLYYKIADSHGAESTADVTFTVHGANDAPTANSDAFSRTAHTLNFFQTGENLLSNDSDPDNGDSLRVHSVEGVVIVGPTPVMTTGANGVVLFTHANGITLVGSYSVWPSLGQGQSVQDTFSYTISDSHGVLSTSSVTVTLNGINDAPTFTTPPADINYVDTSAPDSFADVTGTLAASDPDNGAVLTYGLVGGLGGGPFIIGGVTYDTYLDTDHGTLFLVSTGDDAGKYIFAADDNTIQSLTTGENPTQTFTFTVSDGIAPPVETELTVNITGANDTPILISAAPPLFVINEDSGNHNGLETIEAFDWEGDALQYDLSVPAGHGTAALYPYSGIYAFDYEPDPNFSGRDDFTIEVSDGVSSVSVTVDIDVLPVAETPEVVLTALQPTTPVALGGEALVNTTTASDQYYPTVTALAGGGYVVTWTADGQDGSGSGVYAQVFGSDGLPVDSEFQVNATISNNQHETSVAALTDGGFVVTWISAAQDGSSDGIFGQRYDHVGEAQGYEFQINTQTAESQTESSTTALSDGGFVVVWRSYQQGAGANWDLFGQRYDQFADPVGGEFQVNSTTGNNAVSPSVTALNGGGFVVVWQGDSGPGSTDIFAQRFDAAGITAGDEFIVNSATDFSQFSPSAAPLADGGFVVVWGIELDGGGYQIHGQRFDAFGNSVGGEITVNTTAATNVYYPSATGLDDGGFVVVWTSFDEAPDEDGGGVFAQRFNADGTFAGTPFLVNQTADYDQYSSWTDISVAQLQDGKLVFAWEGEGGGDTYGIFSRTFSTETPPPTGAPNESINLGQILASTADTDGSETLTAVLTGFPDGATFSLGAIDPEDSGRWLLEAGDFGHDLIMTPPDDYSGVFDLAVIVISTDDAVVSTGPVSDAASTSIVLTVTINAPPLLGNDTVVAQESGYIFDYDVEDYVPYGGDDPTGNVLDNDSDPDAGDSLTVVALNGNYFNVGAGAENAYGNFEIAPDGSWTFTVDNGSADVQALREGGHFEFSYTITVSDSHGAEADSTVTIRVNGSEDSPTAVDETVSATEDTPTLFSFASLLANDTDPDAGDTKAIYSLSAITAGFSIGFSGANASFVPTAHFSGVAQFGYTMRDSAGLTSSGVVTVNIAPVAEVATLVLGDATPNAVGPEFRVNTYTTTVQGNPTVTALKGGGTVVTWESYGQDGNVYGIFGQRYAANGTAVGSEFQVNTTTSAEQESASVTALDDGGFVVTWMDSNNSLDGSGYGVIGRMYDGDGSPTTGEFLVNSSTSGGQIYPTVAALDNGGFIAVWASAHAGTWDIYGQKFDASGAADGSQFLVNSASSGAEAAAHVAGLADGGFVVTWTTDGNVGNQDVMAKVFDSSLSPIASEFQVNAASTADQGQSAVAKLSNGGFVVVWETSASGNFDIYARLYAANGTALGSEFMINLTSSSDQQWPSVIGLMDGGFLVSWTSAGQDGDALGVYAQRFDSSGTALGGEFLVNQSTAGDQYNNFPQGWQIAQQADGTLMFVWSGEPFVDQSEVYARQFNIPGYGAEDTPINLGLIDISTADVVDESESIALHLTGFPLGATFNVGAVDPGDATKWIIPNDSLGFLIENQLMMTPPENYSGVFTLTFSAITTDTATLTTGVVTDTETVVRAMNVVVTSANDAPVANGETVFGYNDYIGTAVQVPYSAIQFNDTDADDGNAVFLHSAFSYPVSPSFGPGYLDFLQQPLLTGPETIDYDVSDAHGAVSDTATMTFQDSDDLSFMAGGSGDDIFITLVTGFEEMTGGGGKDVFVFRMDTMNGAEATDYVEGEDAIWVPVGASSIGSASLNSFVRVVDGVLEVDLDGFDEGYYWQNIGFVGGLTEGANDTITILLDDTSSSFRGEIVAQFTGL